MAHTHIITDTDPRFVINPITRKIQNVSSRKVVLIQGDHNSERFTFELPRVIEGHDMTLCNRVEVHYLNTDGKGEVKGLYTVEDLRVDPEDGTKAICSWLISQNATKLVGGLGFVVKFLCVEGEAITYAWSAVSDKDLQVVASIDAAESFEADYADVIEQWKTSVTAEITNEVSAGVTAWAEAESGRVRGLVLEEITKTNKALAVERARIDNIVALPEGSTAGDAELADIRVGADGRVYQTAGTAVRGQFNLTDKKLSLLGDFKPDPTGWSPVNVLEGHIWGEPGRTYDDYGNIVVTEYTKSFTPLTELVEAVPGASYQASGFVGQVRIYTADKVQLDLIYNNAMSNQLAFTAPEEARYFGIYYRHDIINTEEKISAIKLLRTTMTGEELQACPVILTDPRVAFLTLLGKTVVNFGDSIFGNARPPEDISTYLAELTGATVYNCGFGGCRMSYHPSANYDAFSMTKLADAVANNDFSLQDAAIVNTEGDAVPGYFAKGVETLKSIDFGEVDIVTIAYGSNDFNGVRLDNPENPLDVRSFTGALRYSIETLLAAYPHIRVFVCSPTYRFWMDTEYAFIEDSDTKTNGWGYTTVQLLEKAREVSAEYKLPYIDNYHELGINKFNRGQYFPTTDGAHHNPNGRKLIAAHIAKELF